MSTLQDTAPTWRSFSAAPHRLFFWGGALYAVVAGALWTVQQMSLYTRILEPISWKIPPAQAHGFMMVYGVMGFFFLGFLLTTFPRWLDQPPIPRRVFLIAWCGLMAGALLYWIGLFAGKNWSVAGVLLLMGGQGWAWAACLRTLLAANGPGRSYPAALIAALALGLLGELLSALAVAGWWPPGFATARWLGLYGYVLPVVLMVVWRMVPFFTSTVTPDYLLRRGRITLPLLLVLLPLRGVMGWLGADAWTWPVDAALLIILCRELVLWRFWRASYRPLLTILYVGLAWIALSFAISTVESLAVALGWSAVPPFRLAALHAMTVGGFGTLLLGIGTRVSLGHSGRGLATSPAQNALFYGFQAVPILRIAPDLLGFWFPRLSVQGYWSGIGWVLAYLIWFALFDRTLRAPRSDGRPG